MSPAFRKARAEAPPGFFACEAAGLRWLGEVPGVRVVDVLAVGDDSIELERLEPSAPSIAAAQGLGVGLARLHLSPADAFGCPPAGWDGDGFFGPLDDPRRLPVGRHERWGEFYAERRVTPLRDSLDGLVPIDLLVALDRLADRLAEGVWDDAERPVRLHGDLWSGNVVWTEDEAVLIDPAAHGGHRVTDLAMLYLFGLPFLKHVEAAYEEVAPLPEGWRDLVGLHQVYPVGMHAVLFGGAYVDQLARLVAWYV